MADIIVSLQYVTIYAVAPMSPVNDPDKIKEHTLLLVLLMFFLFASPLMLWWASPAHPWFLPYLLWLLVIILGAVISYRSGGHDL